MQSPVSGLRSSSFGLKRFFSGQAAHIEHGHRCRRRHSDQPPAPGVILTTGNYFFNGNTIFLGYGHGFSRLYCHMNMIDVEAGTRVETGELIGRTGQNGRVTGLHLHWRNNLNNTRVDPALFLID